MPERRQRRVLVTGSRDWNDKAALWACLDHEYALAGESAAELVVVHGAARGADALASAWVTDMKRLRYQLVSEERHPADWETHKKRAGVVRNQEMVNLGADVCLAFPLQGGTGTRHCMARAFAAGIPVRNFGFQSHTQQARAFAEAYG